MDKTFNEERTKKIFKRLSRLRKKNNSALDSIKTNIASLKHSIIHDTKAIEDEEDFNMYKFSYDSLVKSYENVLTNYRNLEFDLKKIETDKIKRQAKVVLQNEFTEEQIEEMVNEKPNQVQTLHKCDLPRQKELNAY